MIVAFEIIFLFIKLLSLDFWSSSPKQFKPELVIILKKSTHLRDFFLSLEWSFCSTPLIVDGGSLWIFLNCGKSFKCFYFSFNFNGDKSLPKLSKVTPLYIYVLLLIASFTQSHTFKRFPYLADLKFL